VITHGCKAIDAPLLFMLALPAAKEAVAAAAKTAAAADSAGVTARRMPATPLRQLAVKGSLQSL
jgi:hypothetical protein